jgi:hypothetical protein
MYICYNIYICLYICSSNPKAYLASRWYVDYIYIYVYIWIYMCMYVIIHIYVCIYMFIYMFLKSKGISGFEKVYRLYIYIYIHTFLYISIYIYPFIYVNAYLRRYRNVVKGQFFFRQFF